MTAIAFTASNVAFAPASIAARLLKHMFKPAAADRTVASRDLAALEKGQVVWIEQPFSSEVTCVSGALWLTFDNEQRDVILEAGESHRCDSRSRLGIQSLCAATFRLD